MCYVPYVNILACGENGTLAGAVYISDVVSVLAVLQYEIRCRQAVSLRRSLTRQLKSYINTNNSPNSVPQEGAKRKSPRTPQ